MPTLRRIVAIDCDRCGKPISTAESFEGRPWAISTLEPRYWGTWEEGARRVPGNHPVQVVDFRESERLGRLSTREASLWRSLVWNASTSRPAPANLPAAGGDQLSYGMIDRYKLVCTRKHRNQRGRPVLVQQVVTSETLNRVCEAAIADAVPGALEEVKARITLGDLR